jgi:two-component system NarL family response regulator
MTGGATAGAGRGGSLDTRALRVLVADDHALMRQGVAAVLDEAPGVRVVAEACDGQAAVEAYFAHLPDVALVDLKMPGLDGVATVAAIRARDPHARIVILTTYDADDDVERALRAGARAYLLKDVQPPELVACVRAVAQGRAWVSPEVAAKLAERVTRVALTPREMSVLRELAAGKSNKEIAGALGVVEGTVKVHAARVYEKLGVQNRTEALAVALRRGLLRLPGA